MSRKVLLIEDEPNIAEAIRFLLTREGWQVEIHGDGADALQVIQGAQPDLVYIDGNHNFEYVFTDCFFADKLLRPGGVVAFNDAGWPSGRAPFRYGDGNGGTVLTDMRNNYSTLYLRQSFMVDDPAAVGAVSSGL